MDLKIKALSPKIGTEIPLPYYATPARRPWTSTPAWTGR